MRLVVPGLPGEGNVGRPDRPTGRRPPGDVRDRGSSRRHPHQPLHHARVDGPATVLRLSLGAGAARSRAVPGVKPPNIQGPALKLDRGSVQREALLADSAARGGFYAENLARADAAARRARAPPSGDRARGARSQIGQRGGVNRPCECPYTESVTSEPGPAAGDHGANRWPALTPAGPLSAPVGRRQQGVRAALCRRRGRAGGITRRRPRDGGPAPRPTPWLGVVLCGP